MTIEVTLTAEQRREAINNAQLQIEAIASAAQRNAIPSGAFTFLAAFDGTNNDLENRGEIQTTNVAQLLRQALSGAGSYANISANYYPGPGTKGSLTASAWLPAQVTEQVVNTAERAYADFSRQAKTWLTDTSNPGGITVVLASFSRGDASAAIFSQILYEKGLIDPDDGKTVLIPPGQVKVTAGVLFDPVTTGVSVNLAFAPNVQNVVNIFAANEYRYQFKATDYSQQPGVTTFRMLGSHSDIGGQYDNGIGALALEAATRFLQASGFPLAAVDAARRFDPLQFSIHDESKNPNGTENWSAYTSLTSLDVNSNDRLLLTAPTPATRTTTSDGTVETLTLYNGNTITIAAPADSHSIRVKETSETRDGVRRDVVRDFDGLAYPTTLADEFVITSARDGRQQTIQAKPLINNDSFIIDAPVSNATLWRLGSSSNVPFSVTARSRAGLDIYEITSSAARVRIQDSEGLGYIVRDGLVLRTGIKTASGVWRFGSTTFKQSQDGKNLVISFANDAGGIEVENFNFNQPGSAYLGLRLLNGFAPPGGIVRTFWGDKQDWDADPSRDGVQSVDDGFGNAVRADGAGGRPNILQADRQDLFYGGVGNEVEQFDAAGGDDVIWGDGLNSKTSGVGGADFIKAGTGRDTVAGGGGNDWIEGGPGSDILAGNLGDDALFGDTSNNQGLSIEAAIAAGENAVAAAGVGDLLSGDDGDDGVIGADTSDLMLGGSGDDTLIGNGGHDTIYGDDTFNGASFGWTVTRTVTLLTYTARLSNVEITHNADVGGFDTIYGGAGDDWVFAGGGDDYAEGGAGADVLLGEGGNDVLFGGGDADVLIGDNPGIAASEGRDYLNGGAGNDKLQGNGGEDILVGGAGDDLLVGGAGKDTYIFNVGDGRDQVFDDSTGPEASVLVFGEGYSKNALTVRPGSMLLDFGDAGSVDLASFDHADASAPAAFERLVFADGSVMSFADVLARGFTIIGTEEDDNGHDAAHPTLIGTAFKDNIYGLAGDDVLAGLEGDDFLDGGAGADQLQGGLGDDALLAGDGDDALFGMAGDDILDGGAGRDWLLGGSGDDTYVFGAGDTAYDIAGQTSIYFAPGITASDVVLRRQQTAFQGGSVFSVALRSDLTAYEQAHGAFPEHSLGLTLASDDQLGSFLFADGAALGHAELLRETWIDQAHLVGGVDADTLEGYAGNDYLESGDGDDALHGFGGDDRLEGGNGNDVLAGGAGSDLLLAGAGADTLTGGVGDDALHGGEGSDVYEYVRGDGTDVVYDDGDTASTDVLRFADIASNEVTFARQASGDLLASVAGGGSVAISGFYLLATNRIERVEFAGGVALDSTTLDTLTVAPISGTPEAEVLIGTGYDDTILGLAGDDVLDGGGGDDRLVGGPGIDTYRLRLNGGSDVVVEDRAEASAIELGAGLGFADLSSVRAGDDLVLAVTHGNASVVLSGYYEGQANWSVHSEAGGESALADLVDYLASIKPPTTVAQWRQHYIDDARRQYQTYLASFGANGGITIDDQGASDAASVYRNPPFSETGSFPTFNLNIAHIAGGSSANVFDFRSAASVIADAGAGDDLVDNQGAAFTNGSPSVSIGSFLDGGEGDDTILGTWEADAILGGQGDNYLAGSDGDDTYVIFAADAGVTLIDEVNDDVRIGGHAAFAGARDSADTLVFADVAYDDVSFSISSYDSTPTSGSGYGQRFATLDMTWGDDGTVRLLLPDRNNRNLFAFPGESYGVETIRFADGTTLTQSEILPYVSASDGRALIGTDGNDGLFADGGNDVIDGGPGNDTLNGGPGSDTYVFDVGFGRDVIYDYTPLRLDTNVIRFGDGVPPSEIGVTQDGENIWLVDSTNGDRINIVLAAPGGDDGWGVSRVEFADGTVWTPGDLLARMGPVPPSSRDDLIGGRAGADTLRGLDGDDALFGLAGDDVLLGEGGGDDLVGGDGDDMILGGEGADYPEGDAGYDILLGGEGDDDIEEWDLAGNNLMEGDSGDDYLYEEGHSFVAGGMGDDWIDSYGADAVIAFNAGDGADTLTVADTATISLGGGIGEAGVSLREDGSSLVLASGADSIRFSLPSWFAPGAWPAMRLQIVGEEIRVYDLNGVFNAFYAHAGVDASSPMAIEELLPAYRAISTYSQAYGGDVAVLYARGELNAAADRDSILAVLRDQDFGIYPQAITRPFGPPMIGGTNADFIVGTLASETIAAGPGDDLLFGGAGDDTYFFGAGDGIDTLFDPIGSNTVVFGEGIDTNSLSLGLGSLLVRVGAAGAIHFESFDPANPYGPRDADRFVFADGTVLSYEALIDRGFDLDGTERPDHISGTATADRIRGGRGGDVLAGGQAGDTYFYDTGDGSDTIIEPRDPSAIDLLAFGAGIEPGEIGAARAADDLVITLAEADDSIILRDWYGTAGPGIERFSFADGTTWDAAYLQGLVGTNGSPFIAVQLADLRADEDSAFRFIVPAAAFADPDSADSLEYVASLADGSPLPAWLAFDGASAVLSGAPDDEDIGSYSIRITATDRGGLSAYQDFNLTVAGVNDAPIANADAVTGDEESPLAIAAAALLGNDVDEDASDTLHLVAVSPRSAAGASVGVLGTADAGDEPQRVIYDPASLFQWLPQGAQTSDSFSYTIRDAAGASSTGIVDVTITGVNDAPVPVADAASLQEDGVLAAVGDVLLNDRDVDDGDQLVVASPGTFAGQYGTLTLAGDGTYSYALANDSLAVQSLGRGRTVADIFDYAVRDAWTETSGQLAVSVLGANDAPVLLHAIADVDLIPGQTFNFRLPANTFIDIDQGDAFSFAAAAEGGAPLPTWVAFDAATQTFRGIAQVGTLHLQVTATDTAAATATAEFAIRVPVIGGSRNDHLSGSDGDDYVYGGAGNDQIAGGPGDDILQGGSGNDTATNQSGNALLDGGAGNDTLIGAAGNELYSGGIGNDVLRLGAGHNIVAFNVGDGKDTVHSGSGNDVLSLGGVGLDYTKLRLEKENNDLLLKVSDTDQVTFKDWYAGPEKQTLLNLQIIADAVADFDRSSSNPLRNQSVEHFDFRGLVHAVDAARETTGLSAWAITDALTRFHLSGSDAAANGGDLAYWYGRNGNFTGISVAAAQQIIGAAGFGAEAQQLHPFSGLQEGFVKLA